MEFLSEISVFHKIPFIFSKTVKIFYFKFSMQSKQQSSRVLEFRNSGETWVTTIVKGEFHVVISKGGPQVVIF